MDRGWLAGFALAAGCATACADPAVRSPAGLYAPVGIRMIDPGLPEVDLLVVVDDSEGMAEEQARFADLIVDLVMPADADGDGAPDWNAVSNPHVGVVSSDMGTGGVPAGCADAELGDDGVLQSEPAGVVAGCDVTYPKFLTFDPVAGDDARRFAEDLRCVATLGTAGCGWEQPLAALEKAVTVHAGPGGANEGFLRPDAILAVVIVTNEDDCSVDDPAIFGEDAALGPLELRCLAHPQMLRRVDALVASVLSAKPGRPERIFVAAIGGVPPDLAAPDEQDFDAMLADPRMSTDAEAPLPSCEAASVGTAFAPRRIVELLGGIADAGGRGLAQSTCQDDWTDAARAIAGILGSLHPDQADACLSDVLVQPDGSALSTGEHASCKVLETIQKGASCGPGRFQVEVNEEGVVCQLCQTGDGEPPHELDFEGTDLRPCAGAVNRWSYVAEADWCPDGGIAFTPEPMFADGSRVSVQCLNFIEGR